MEEGKIPGGEPSMSTNLFFYIVWIVTQNMESIQRRYIVHFYSNVKIKKKYIKGCFITVVEENIIDVEQFFQQMQGD